MLDGDGFSLVNFTFELKHLMILLIFIFSTFIFSFFQNDLQNWVTRETKYYSLTKTVNLLQEQALLDINSNLFTIKRRYLAMHDEINYLQTLLGVNEKYLVKLKMNELEDHEKVRIEKIVLGRRIERYTVLFNNKMVMEFYEDTQKTATDNISAEKRALQAATQIQKIIRDSSFIKKKVTIHPLLDQENVCLGLLGDTIIFRTEESDSIYLNSKTEEIAQKWANRINHEFNTLVSYHKNIKIHPLLSNPYKTDYKKIQNKITILNENMDQTIALFNNISNYANQFTRHFARTPSAYPLNRQLTSTYGLRKHPITHKYRYHSGVDFWAWPGTRIHATAGGRVVHAGWYGGYGYAVKIYHGKGMETLYAHCSKLVVNKGDIVKKGQVISLSGASGLAVGAHLHYEIRKYGRAINPTPYLDLNIYTASSSGIKLK
jgi:peptidase M23-like protein